MRFKVLSKPSTYVWMLQSVWSFETAEWIYMEFLTLETQQDSSVRVKFRFSSAKGFDA